MKFDGVEFRQVGIIGVDAGLCWIGDPCYCVTPDANEHPAPTWDDFCEFLEAHEDHGYCQWNYRQGHPGLGVTVRTGYGDGTYPVYAAYKDGRVAAVFVDYMGLFANESD